MSRASLSSFGTSGDSDLTGTNPGRVKPMTLKMCACRFLVRQLALLGQGKDWLAQGQDNVTEWEIRSLCSRPGHPMEQHYKVTRSV